MMTITETGQRFLNPRPTLIDLVELWATENHSDKYVTVRGVGYSSTAGQVPILKFFDKSYDDGLTMWLLTLDDNRVWTEYLRPVPDLRSEDPEFFEKLTTILDLEHHRRNPNAKD